jgi:hypothetical protein
MRRALPILGALVVAVALDRLLVERETLRIALPEIVVALAVSVWAFATEERPLLHEAHELGVGPRALVQAVAVVLVMGVVAAHRECCEGHSGVLALGSLEAALLLLLPAYAETRLRVEASSLQRDILAALLVILAGAVALELGGIAAKYTEIQLRSGTKDALDFLRHHLDRADVLELLRRDLLPAIGFAPPALARLHEARPRHVLLAGLAGSALAAEAQNPMHEYPGFFEVLVWNLPYGIALSLGPAFGDKLTRKLEKFFPKSHSHG